jgi:hypothetical protein
VRNLLWSLYRSIKADRAGILPRDRTIAASTRTIGNLYTMPSTSQIGGKQVRTPKTGHVFAACRKWISCRAYVVDLTKGMHSITGHGRLLWAFAASRCEQYYAGQN